MCNLRTFLLTLKDYQEFNYKELALVCFWPLSQKKQKKQIYTQFTDCEVFHKFAVFISPTRQLENNHLHIIIKANKTFVTNALHLIEPRIAQTLINNQLLH